MKKPVKAFLSMFVLWGALLLQGCGLEPFIPVVVSSLGGAASYSILNTAHKTEIYPEKDVLRCSIRALNKMGFVITDTQRAVTGWEIAAETTERKITVELERITPKTTKVTVNVVEGSIMKDKATAEAIIAELEVHLEKGEHKDKKRRNAFLFVKSKPAGATVRIMNISPKFMQGIELKPGMYDLEISSDDFETRSMTIRLKPYEERFLEVLLKKKKKPINPDPKEVKPAN